MEWGSHVHIDKKHFLNVEAIFLLQNVLVHIHGDCIAGKCRVRNAIEWRFRGCAIVSLVVDDSHPFPLDKNHVTPTTRHGIHHVNLCSELQILVENIPIVTIRFPPPRVRVLLKGAEQVVFQWHNMWWRTRCHIVIGLDSKMERIADNCLLLTRCPPHVLNLLSCLSGVSLMPRPSPSGHDLIQGGPSIERRKKRVDEVFDATVHISCAVNNKAIVYS